MKKSPPKSGPLRTCIGCRQVAPVSQLARVYAVNGQIKTGGGVGRGAWVGPTQECVDLATKHQAWNRALRAEVKAGEIAKLSELWLTDSRTCLRTSS